jgi:hypothetical protein
MKKNSRVELRVQEKELELLKVLGLHYSHVWDLGMEHIYKNMPKYAEKMYVQIGEKQANVRTINDGFTHRNSQLDQLCEDYLANRDIYKPTCEDKNWVSAKVTKIDGLTVEGFFTYCKLYVEGKKNEMP